MQTTRTNPDEPGEAMLIAPHEVRELISRLTEQSVEGVRFDEPRTLAGLSLETGIPTDQIRQTLRQMHGRGRNRQIWGTVMAGAAMGVIGWIAVTHMPTNIPSQASVAPIEISGPPAQYSPQVREAPPQTGLVPVTQVTYGPDSGNELVDPTFSPPHPMPAGLSISVGINNVIWGAGDRHTGAIHNPFDKPTESDLRENIIALLRHVRNRAGKFGLKSAERGAGDLTLKSDGPSFNAILEENDYNGIGSQSISIPIPGKDHDAEANRIFKQAANNLASQLQDRLRWLQQNRSDLGPQ